MSGYQSVKKWRNSNEKRKTYNAEYMKFRRRHYKTLWRNGNIKYEDIPHSFRYWKP